MMSSSFTFDGRERLRSVRTGTSLVAATTMIGPTVHTFNRSMANLHWERTSCGCLDARGQPTLEGYETGLGRCSSAQKSKGPALLPAPPAPSEGSAGVRNLEPQGRSPLVPFSILAHQLRRRFRNGGPVRRPIRAILPRPFLGQHLFASCFARCLPEGRFWCRIAQRDRCLFRRPLPGWPRLPRPEGLFRHCRPAEIGLSAPSSLPGCPASGDGDIRPDHP